MNILYLHGLESKLSERKRDVLAKYGTVTAPDLDYPNDPDAVLNLIANYQNSKFDVVMGSSMGGFAGYHIANAFSLPALLFNPALVKRSVPQNIPETEISDSGCRQIVLGGQDTVVNPADTLNYIGKDFGGGLDYHLHLKHNMAHRVPMEVFEEEVESFFQHLAKSEFQSI
tara:strand:- start:401 stop:913 length:513 start_codon:yes stop_codon:yes gene_type:complete